MLRAPDEIAPQEGLAEDSSPLGGCHPSRRAWLCQAGTWLIGGLPAAPLMAATLKPSSAPAASSPAVTQTAHSAQAVILVYHRFADTVQDSMTVRKQTFADHIQVLRDAGVHIIPMTDLVAFRQGKLKQLPPRSVVITADDGHRSVVETMAPMLEGTNWPVTLYIYPSAISNASYAMRWEDLQTLQATGHYDVQSHTYWHPNLVKERKAQSPADFQRFADKQFQTAKAVLERRMHKPVSTLAWPFGVFDETLMEMASAAGYQAALALGNRPCMATDPVMALPRYLMVDELSGKRLKQILSAAWPPGAPT